MRVDGSLVEKPAQLVNDDACVEYTPPHPFVSRGALKLLAALDRFSFSPEGRVCLDIGASTGGFTEVLLARGAAKVYAVDVGHGQLHAKLRADKRVINLEGVNARALSREQIDERPDCVTADISFISARLALPPALALAGPGAWLVLLFKPQFEVGPGGLGKGGIVRDEALGIAACKSMETWLSSVQGWIAEGAMDSPIRGGDGNREYLIAARKL